MKTVQLSAGDWRVEKVGFAESFFDRLLGIRHKGATNGVVLPATGLQTFGMASPLEAFSMDREHRVVEVRAIPPNRLVWFRHASHVVELPAGTALPDIGTTVEILHE